jgi:hypothetical protein
VTPHRFFGVHGPKACHEDARKYFFDIVIHGKRLEKTFAGKKVLVSGRCPHTRLFGGRVSRAIFGA